MEERVINKSQWSELIKKLQEGYQLWGPVKEDGYHVFKILSGEKELDLSFQNTRLSIKSFVLPQSERMLEAKLDEENGPIYRESPKEYPNRVLLGVRPCDAKALELVRVNFDTPEYKDPWWLRRYETLIKVGLACNTPCSTCFCPSTGGGPFDEEGLDILMVDIGDEYFFKAVSEKGNSILREIEIGEKPSDSVKGKVEELKKKAEASFTNLPSVENLASQDMMGLFNAPFWDESQFACINCGTCTYLCPTCWCFDIQDEIYENISDRIRNWDSCMYPLFTLHGSGHNPRSQKLQRVRQRFMHKLKYYVDKYSNGVQCVGCGRCIQYCPVNIDIREVISLMNNYQADACEA